jgi:hypothetical protein
MTRAELEASLTTLDTLIQVFALLVALGIVGEVGFGVRHWVLNRRLRVIQQAEDLNQQENTARLNKEAGAARKDAASAVERASQANERAEQLAHENAGLQIQILNMEARSAPRRVTPKQRDLIVSLLHGRDGTPIFVHTLQGGSDTANFSQDLSKVFQDARFAVSFSLSSAVGGLQSNSGLHLFFKPEYEATASVIANALRKSGLVNENNPLEVIPSQNWDGLSLLVGPKVQE